VIAQAVSAAFAQTCAGGDALAVAQSTAQAVATATATAYAAAYTKVDVQGARA
jgi:hypothetical protein